MHACLDALAAVAREKKQAHVIARARGVSARDFSVLVFWGLHRHLARYDPSVRSSAFWLDESSKTASSRIIAYAQFILSQVAFVYSALDASARWFDVPRADKLALSMGVDFPIPKYIRAHLESLKLLDVHALVDTSPTVLQALGFHADDVSLLESYLYEYGLHLGQYLVYRNELLRISRTRHVLPTARLYLSVGTAKIIASDGKLNCIDDLLECSESQLRRVINLNASGRKELKDAIRRLPCNDG